MDGRRKDMRFVNPPRKNIMVNDIRMGIVPKCNVDYRVVDAWPANAKIDKANDRSKID